MSEDTHASGCDPILGLGRLADPTLEPLLPLRVVGLFSTGPLLLADWCVRLSPASTMSWFVVMGRN